MSGPAGWTAREIGERVGRREVSAVEVVAAHLARAEEVEPAVRAFVAREPEAALARAAEIDRRLRRGEAVGPLAGVPLAVKDNLARAGRPLTCASRMLAGHVAPYTATAVARLEAAGAVVVGATNMDEFAMGSSSETSAFGPTRNPLDPARSPGGSSGGSAAAVAAGAAALALGSDTGGSIRQPAAFCGLVGLKPTWGRVSRRGLVAFASSLDVVGPIARDAADAALALRLVAGPDGRDATCSGRDPAELAAAAEEGGDGLAGRRIGVPAEVDGVEMTAAAHAAWRSALDRLAAAGAELVPVPLPALADGIAAYAVIAAVEAAANLARFDGVRCGPRVAAAGHEEAVAASRRAGFGEEVRRRLLFGTYAATAVAGAASLERRARALAATLRCQLLAAFEACDLLATPTAPSVAFPLGERKTDPLAMYRSDVFTVPANLAGLPAISLPAGVADHGLPFGVQLMARPFEEALLVRAALAFEAMVGE